MIPQAHIINWRSVVPWPSDAQVEQDLVISRALVEIFNQDFLSQQLAFRGGTALHKLFIDDKSRYSEDIDLVVTEDQDYGPVIDALRSTLSSWLGKPQVDTKPTRIILRFNFESEIPPVQKLKLKVEINTQEHFNILGIKEHDFEVENPWFSGKTKIKTFDVNELLGTKLRALYQRKKGRDLFDLDIAHTTLSINPEKIIECFGEYISKQDLTISRAQFEENLHVKKSSTPFLNDIKPLLRQGHQYDMETGFKLLNEKFMPLLNGDPWKGNNN